MDFATIAGLLVICYIIYKYLIQDHSKDKHTQQGREDHLTRDQYRAGRWMRENERRQAYTQNKARYARRRRL